MSLLDIEGVTVSFDDPSGNESRVIALDEVNLDIKAGETLALVGESGSGKSTLAHSIVRLNEIDRGSIRFDGVEIGSLGSRELSQIRSRIGLIMQDSASSLNPSQKVISSISSPLQTKPAPTRAERGRLASQALSRVGLDPELGARHPYELSGGQRQRVCLARAIVTEPELLICDEPLAGLDLMTEASMLEVLRDSISSTACLFITHDLFLAAAIGDRIAVMREGRIVEEGPAEKVLSRPAHPHTQELIAAIPPAGPDPAWQDRHGIVRPDQPPLEAGT